MSFKDYEKALKLIETGKEITCFIGGASDILIKNAEKRLNLSFSKIYKDFLLRFGAMSFGTEEFYGIVNENFDNSRIPDAIWYTLEERKKVNLPDHLLVFYDTGSEELFCLDFNKLNFDGEPKVVVFVPGVDLQYQSYEVISNDFGEFLLQKVKLELENS
jgi:antitoxin YobK